MVAYVYSIRFKITNQWYVGCRYAKHLTDKTVSQDLWIQYFTSSKLVKSLIKAYGYDSFEPKIRKIFDSPEQAKTYEARLLKKVNARIHPAFLNQCNSVFENTPTMAWITNGSIDTMIARDKPLIYGFWYGRSCNNRTNRSYKSSPLKGRIHVLEILSERRRLIAASEYNPILHLKLTNDFNKGRKWVYNPLTNECKLIKKDGLIPNGWQCGNPHRGTSSWFYNPVTGEEKQVSKNSKPPLGFLKGRFIKHTWFTNPLTGENLLCKIDQPPPDGFIKGRVIKGKEI
jgi:hypothetical protein